MWPWVDRGRRWLAETWVEVTLEPAIFVYVLSESVAYGAGQTTELMLWKVCNVVKHYNSTVCDHLNDPQYKDVMNEVQIYVNNFVVKSSLLHSWPAIIYVFFAGALSDRLGRKYLICLPVFGVFISTIFLIINYAFIWQLPMEFFYLDNLESYLGGTSMYFIGIYAYGTDVSTPQNRAQRLAMYDGMERAGLLLGTVISPYYFKATGYYGAYGFRLVCVALALAYWLKYVKSPDELQEEAASANGYVSIEGDNQDRRDNISNRSSHSRSDDGSNQEIDVSESHPIVIRSGEEEAATENNSFTNKYVVTPLKEFKITLTKRRTENLRTLLYINFFIYTLYMTTISYTADKYLYMDLVFAHFTGQKYATLIVVQKIVACFSLFALMPLFLTKLNWHETTLQVIICVLEVASLTCAAFATNIVPQFSLALAVSAVDACLWALVRSVFTKIVNKDEVGKVFSMVALISAATTTFSVPAFKKIYNATLTVFPAAFLLVGASMFAVALALNLIMFAYRARLWGEAATDQEREHVQEQEEAAARALVRRQDSQSSQD